jgi:hypothetical protein
MYRLNSDDFIRLWLLRISLGPSNYCRVSSAVEQRFCKPLVGGSSPSPGTNRQLVQPGHIGDGAAAEWAIADQRPSGGWDDGLVALNSFSNNMRSASLTGFGVLGRCPLTADVACAFSFMALACACSRYVGTIATHAQTTTARIPVPNRNRLMAAWIITGLPSLPGGPGEVGRGLHLAGLSQCDDHHTSNGFPAPAFRPLRNQKTSLNQRFSLNC